MRAIVLLGVVAALAAVVLAVPMTTVASSGGAVSGHTGAPAVNGRTCTACHASQLNGGPGTLSIITPVTTFVPGSVIPLEVRLGGTIQNPNKNGYQMAAYTGNTWDTIVSGGWVSPDLTESRIISEHIGHAAGGNQQTAWKMYFRTPTTLQVPFTLYCAGNDANGNGRNDSGDLVYATSKKMTPGPVPLSLRSVPSPGTGVQLDLDAPGDGNRAYVLAASFGNRGISLGGRTVPLDADALLVVTVQNLAPGVFQGYQGVLDAGGRAAATLAVPALTALKGITVHHAFVVLDASGPGGIGTISNGLPVAIF
jgi:hypothetical protein